MGESSPQDRRDHQRKWQQGEEDGKAHVVSAAIAEKGRSQQRAAVQIGGAGLDVQQGRAVQHIHMRDVEDIPVPAQQRYQTHADVAWTAGSTGSEDAAFLRLPVRDDLQARSLRPVEGEDQPDAGKALQAFKPGHEFGKMPRTISIYSSGRIRDGL